MLQEILAAADWQFSTLHASFTQKLWTDPGDLQLFSPSLHVFPFISAAHDTFPSSIFCGIHIYYITLVYPSCVSIKKKCSCILSVYLKNEIWDRVCQGFNTQSVKHNTNPQVMGVGNGGAQMDSCKVIYASLMYGRQNQLKLLYFLHQGFKKNPSSLLEESLQQCHAMFLFLFGLLFLVIHIPLSVFSSCPTWLESIRAVSAGCYSVILDQWVKAQSQFISFSQEE